MAQIEARRKTNTMMFGKFILLSVYLLRGLSLSLAWQGHVRTGFSLETGIRGPAGLGGDTLCIKSTVVLSELQLHRYRICAEFFPDTNVLGIRNQELENSILSQRPHRIRIRCLVRLHAYR